LPLDFTALEEHQLTLEEYARAKRANDRVAYLLVTITLIWAPIYIVAVRPVLNRWLADYIDSYPAALHLILIFAPMFILGMLLSRRFPAPKVEDVQTSHENPSDNSR